MTSGNHTIIDIGEMVLCDLCNADYTDSEDERRHPHGYVFH